MNKSTKYSKVLFILHMPPPVHGASMVGKYIHDSKIINNAFECHYPKIRKQSQWQSQLQ